MKSVLGSGGSLAEVSDVQSQGPLRTTIRRGAEEDEGFSEPTELNLTEHVGFP